MTLFDIYATISEEGFSPSTIEKIKNYTLEIQNGTINFHRFNIPEHAGLCNAGSVLIGASIIASYATASLSASSDATEGQRKPTNWQIDQLQDTINTVYFISSYCPV